MDGNMANDQQISVAEEALKREFQQEVLNRMRQYLCNHLEPERFFPYLQQRNYLDTESCDQIRNAGTTRSKVNKMLDILMRSGRRPLFALVKAIEKCSPTQKFIAKRLREEHDIWMARSENISRLESVRQMPNATALYDDHLEPMPPPYQPYSGYSYPPHMPPPLFTLPVSGIPKTDPKSFDPPLPPMSYDRVPSPNTRSRSPGYTSYVSSFGPSHFQTIDFPDNSNNQTNTAFTEPVSLIHSDQLAAERKIPPPPGGAQAPSLDDKIHSSQQKELVRYESKTHSSTPTNWPRSARTPSEHEVTNNERIPINGAHRRNAEVETSVTETLEAPMRGLRFQMSCQSTSFQPSSFNYSTNESDPRPDAADSLKDTQRRCTTYNPRTNPSTRDYSSPLETIRSGEVLEKLFTSLPTNKVSQCTRNPMEHTDASMIPQDNLDDTEADWPLEISTNSTLNGL